jgi:hypothetical protein
MFIWSVFSTKMRELWIRKEAKSLKQEMRSIGSFFNWFVG